MVVKLSEEKISMERTFNALFSISVLLRERYMEEASLCLKKKSIKGMPHCKGPFKVHYMVKMRLSFQLKCDE